MLKGFGGSSARLTRVPQGFTGFHVVLRIHQLARDIGVPRPKELNIP